MAHIADTPDIGGARAGGPRNIEMRFTMMKMLILHSALQHRHETLAKDAWWAQGRGDLYKAARLNEQAVENHDVADRLFAVLSGMMGTRK